MALRSIVWSGEGAAYRLQVLGAQQLGSPGIHPSAFCLSQCFAYASARRKPREDKGVCGGRSGWCMRQTRSLAYDDQVMPGGVSDCARKQQYRYGSGMGTGSLPIAFGSVRLLAALFRRAYEKRFEADADKGEACPEAAGLALGKRGGGSKTG